MAALADRSDQVKQTLLQLAGDRTLSDENRALAADLLEILPELQSLRQRGYGELVAQYRGARLVHVDCRLQRQIVHKA